MKEQTAVDFLHSKILLKIGLDDNDILELRELVLLAKAIEKQQHGETWDYSIENYQARGELYARAWEDFDDYYKETFNK